MSAAQDYLLRLPCFRLMHWITHYWLHPLIFGCHPDRCEIRHTLK